MRPEDLDHYELFVLLSTLRPDHPLVAAARGGVDVSAGRAEAATAQCDVQGDIAASFRDRPAEPPGFGTGVAAMQRQQAADSRKLAEQTRGRAETADPDTRRYLEAEARGHDERAARAEQRIAERNAGTPPCRRDTTTDEQRKLTASLVAEAREHLADRELREEQRRVDGGLTREDDTGDEMCAS